MLSDNIKNFRKKSNMSQDELAEKLGVSRQSISLWETGQTQPTIDNIIALAKIFNISSDMLLGSSDSIYISQDKSPADKSPKIERKTGLILTIVIAASVIIGAVILAVFLCGNYSEKSDADNETVNNSVIQLEKPSENSTTDETAYENINSDTSIVSGNNSNNSSEKSDSDNETANNSVIQSEDLSGYTSSNETASENIDIDTSKVPNSDNVNNTNDTSIVPGNNSNNSDVDNNTDAPVEVQFDLFSYCKDFAIKKGALNGDYCIYQQPAEKYGGYENEYFSITYWSDSNMVEFCLHCPLSETYSINFYLRMRGGYYKKYEYLSSKYFRDTGESLRSATGYIDPAVFSDSYPISCDRYEGSFDGQNDFMEESRVGICDLIHCLKEFVRVENMECDFYDFEFVNF